MKFQEYIPHKINKTAVRFWEYVLAEEKIWESVYQHINIGGGHLTMYICEKGNTIANKQIAKPDTFFFFTHLAAHQNVSNKDN